jgi:hypothetical protein
LEKFFPAAARSSPPRAFLPMRVIMRRVCES